MNIIIHELSTILNSKIGNIEFNTDFRTSILFEMLMQNRNIKKTNKIIQALKLYYPNIEQLTNIEEALENIVWFYRGGKELANSNKKNDNNKKQIYSYEFDDEYIYSAFLQQYNIDLQDIEYLHWWKFKAMFEGLSKDTKIVEIMGYRAIDLGKIKDKTEKAKYKKLKEAYSLPDMRTKEQKEMDFGRAFW